MGLKRCYRRVAVIFSPRLSLLARPHLEVGRYRRYFGDEVHDVVVVGENPPEVVAEGDDEDGYQGLDAKRDVQDELHGLARIVALRASEASREGVDDVRNEYRTELTAATPHTE